MGYVPTESDIILRFLFLRTWMAERPEVERQRMSAVTMRASQRRRGHTGDDKREVKIPLLRLKTWRAETI